MVLGTVAVSRTIDDEKAPNGMTFTTPSIVTESSGGEHKHAVIRGYYKHVIPYP